MPGDPLELKGKFCYPHRNFCFCYFKLVTIIGNQYCFKKKSVIFLSWENQPTLIRKSFSATAHKLDEEEKLVTHEKPFPWPSQGWIGWMTWIKVILSISHDPYGNPMMKVVTCSHLYSEKIGSEGLRDSSSHPTHKYLKRDSNPGLCNSISHALSPLPHRLWHVFLPMVSCWVLSITSKVPAHKVCHTWLIPTIQRTAPSMGSFLCYVNIKIVQSLGNRF